MQDQTPRDTVVALRFRQWPELPFPDERRAEQERYADIRKRPWYRAQPDGCYTAPHV